MGAVLSLLASLSWGTADFLGGTLSRRLHPLRVMRSSQLWALGALVLVAAATGELDAPNEYLWWGVAGGVAGLIALGCFYAGLAQGTMGVVAPITSVGVVVPVVVGLVGGEAPSTLQIAGIVPAVVGVVLASGPERSAGARDRRPMLYATVAAVGFGAVLVFVAEGSEHSVVMTLLTMRVVNVAITSVVLAVGLRGTPGPRRRDLATTALIGAGDTGANALYAAATGLALVSVSAVLASLYPAVTAVLAWRFHGERLRREQVAGVALILVGVALIAAG